MSVLKNFQLKKDFKSVLLFSFLLLISINIGCTGRQSQLNSRDLDLDEDSFGDIGDASEDDIFSSDFDFNSEDFLETNLDDVDEDEIIEENDNFDVDISNDMITSCINPQIFPNLGASVNADGTCIDDGQLGINGMDSALQILLMQALYSFDYMNQCLGAAIQLDPLARRDPAQGFVLAQLSIVQCYRQVQRVIAASRRYAHKERAKMQGQEEQYLQLLMMLLKDDEF